MRDYLPETSENPSKLMKILNDAVSQRAFPGGVLTVGYEDELAFLPVGRLTYEEDSPKVTSKTIYDLASLTKAVATTTAAMILVERGMLGLDEPVATYLPEFVGPRKTPKDPLRAARAEVKVGHLLAHSSGLPAYEKFFLKAKDKSQVLEAAMALPLETAPDKRTLYSDVGFILLGEILERVSKISLDSLCNRGILGPLQMRQTRFNPPEEWLDRIAPTELDESFRKRLIRGEVQDENAWVMGGVAGHAGLFGTAGNLASFCRMMLREGRVGEMPDAPQLVQPATIREFTRAWPAEEGSPRGLGWDKPSEPSSSGSYFSSSSYGHLGFTGTSLWIDPEKSLFIILLTNRVHPSRSNEAIRQLRPALHDAVAELIGFSKKKSGPAPAKTARKPRAARKR
jgi:CubicO group peptidase (beta-lactamase class C family)